MADYTVIGVRTIDGDLTDEVVTVHLSMGTKDPEKVANAAAEADRADFDLNDRWGLEVYGVFAGIHENLLES
jgi:hypothetical protein